MPKEVYSNILVLNGIGLLGPGTIITLCVSVLFLFGFIIVELLNGCL